MTTTGLQAELAAAQAQLGVFAAALYDAMAREQALPADRTALLAALAPLLEQARAARWSGLHYLCSVLERGLADPVQRAQPLAIEDLVGLVAWNAELDAYLRAELSGPDCVRLLEALEHLSFCPSLPPDLRALILSRLRSAAWLPTPQQSDATAASAVVAEPTQPVPNPPDPVQEAYAVTAAEDAALPSEHPQAEPAPPALEVAAPPGETIETSTGSSTSEPVRRWVSEDERSLLLQALEEQVLDSAGLVVTAVEPAAVASSLAALGEELALLGNAFEVMELPCLHAEVERVRTNLQLWESVPDGLTPEQAAMPLEWALALSAWVQTQQADTVRQLLACAGSDHWLAPDFNLSALAAELRQVCIGTDPALRATRKIDVQPEDVQLLLAADVAPAVKEGMLRELPGNVAELGERLERLVRSGDEQDLDVAQRLAHTLKGDANIVGLNGIANLTHALEDILVELKRQPRKPTAELGQAMLDTSDCVAAMADHVLGHGPPPEDALEVYQLVLDWANRAADGELDAPVQVAERTVPPPSSDPSPQEPVATPAAAADTEDADEPVPTMAVPVPLLDSVLQLCGEAVVLTRQVEQLLRSLRGQQREFKSGSSLFERLAAQLEDLVSLRGAALQSTRLSTPDAIDPLELDQYDELHTVSRRIQEIGSDQRDFTLGSERALNQLLDLINEQERLHGELQRQVLQTRKVAVSSIVPRLKRAVRQTARSLLKEAELHVHGEEQEIDSDILSGLVDPLMHAVRNAVDHGIEAPDERVAAGKTEVGQIQLKVRQDGVHVLLELTDDGRGLDLERIRDKALALRLIEADAVPPPQELARLILHPGFSTRDSATQISGRGIGMDVVASRVRALKGTLQIHTDAGTGTRFQIRVPADLNTTQVLVAGTAQGVVAVATDRLERLVLLLPHEVLQREHGLAVRYLGQTLDAFELEPLCFGGDWRLPQTRAHHVAMLYRSEQGSLRAVLTSNLSDARTVIVSRLGMYAPVIAGVRGATVLGDGRVAPVIDLPELVDAVTASNARPIAVVGTRVRPPRALVADDSLSVRRALEQLLRDAGFEVEAVRDGLEALGSLNRQTPDVLLVDLEMPKLNGLEVTSFVRSTEQFKALPVVMITSRTGERHRQLAREAGVDLLLTKPYSDEYLLEFLGRRVHAQV